jgi:YebC/PmpR family DNA-binding regulatory protein
LIKEITVAARMGGGDINGNPRLRTAVDGAKAANMPQSNIDRAIKKGTGELPGVVYEEINYEAYGPGGVALLIEVMTDNKNRTVGEIKHIVSKYGGNFAESGAVAWMFSRKGVITVNPKGLPEDAIMELALEAGAEDMSEDDGNFEIVTETADFDAVKEAVESSPVEILSAEITMVPSNYVKVEGADVKKLMNLLEHIEENDDVQNIHGNFDIDPEEMED